MRGNGLLLMLEQASQQLHSPSMQTLVVQEARDTQGCQHDAKPTGVQGKLFSGL